MPHAPQRKLRRIVSEFRAGILNGRPSAGMCAAVAWPLQALLSMGGVETVIVEADFARTNHIWLECADGTIIDPTADQFSTPEYPLPPVYIGPLPDIYAKWIAESR